MEKENKVSFHSQYFSVFFLMLATKKAIEDKVIVVENLRCVCYNGCENNQG